MNILKGCDETIKHLNWKFIFKLCIVLNIIILSSCVSKKYNSFSRFEISGFAQGTSYTISYYAQEPVISSKSIDSIFMELDNSLSIYKANSLINKFNNSKEGTAMDEHLYKVVKRALKIWKESEGVFDIAILPIVDVWGFGVKRHSKEPSEAEIKNALLCSGSKKLHIRGKFLVKDVPCLKIDVNGIAQGYSVDVMANYLEARGIKNYLIEIGGEIRVKGRKQPGNQVMRIGMEEIKNNEDKGFQKIVNLRSGAITTSGSYSKYLQNGSKKFSHLMDPKTGRPINNQLISVSVRTNNAMNADAYDNVLIGQNLEKAFVFLNKHKALSAYFIFKNEDGLVKDTASAGFFK